jgi:hypothetical protein
MALMVAVWFCFGVRTQAADQYHAFISAFAGGGQMVLNGFPVMDCDAAPITKTTIWNPYLKQGNNDLIIILTNTTANGARLELELSVGQGDSPARFALISVKSKPEGGYVTFVDAVRGITNTTLISRKSMTNGFDLKNSLWRAGNDLSISVNNGTLVVLCHFSVNEFPCKKLPWDESPNTLSRADVESLQSYAASMVDAFRKQDVDHCIALYEVRNHHLAESLGLPANAVDDSQRKIFSDLNSDKEAKLVVAKSEEIVPQSETGWKVVRLKCQPLLKVEGKNSSFIAEHFYARVGGKWVCVD